MVSNLVPSGLDPGQYIGMAQDSFSNQKKSGFGILPFEDLQHLRCEGAVRAVIERERHEGKVRSDAINDLGSESFERPEDEQRLRPKQNQSDYGQSSARHKKHESVSHATPADYGFPRRSPETPGRVGSRSEKPPERPVAWAWRG